MTDRMVVTHAPMRDTETRIGLAQPIERLLNERAALVKQTASLRAVYAAWGTWDATRKATLSRIAAGIRAQRLRDGIKITDGGIDEAAHASPEYWDFITRSTNERAEWAVAEDRLDGIEQLIRRENAIISYLSAETRL